MARPKKEKPNHATGMYEVKVTVGKTFDGKPIRKSFYSAVSKAEARLKAEEYIVNSRVAEQTGEQFVSSQTSFATWAEKWLETYKKPNVKPHTYKWTYETNVVNYFIPYFGKAPLTNIRQIDIQGYFNAHKSSSMTTLRRQKTILYDIFDAAIDNDLCYKNPVKNIVISSDKEDFEKRWYNREQADKLRQYCLCTDSKYSQVIFLLISLGLRRGELLGLMWKDIDTDNCVVSVRRAVEPDTADYPRDGEVKSRSSLRDIPYDNDAELVRFLNKIAKEEHKSNYVIPGNTKYGFTSIYGFDKSYKTFMKTACEKLNLPYMTPHELRHSYGTILRQQGLDTYSISKLMGHSNSAVTEKHYIGNDIEVLRQKLRDLNSGDIDK